MTEELESIDDVTVFVPIENTDFSEIESFIETALAEQGLSAEQYAMVPLNDEEGREQILQDLFDLYMISSAEDGTWIVYLLDNEVEVPCHLRVLKKIQLH